MSALLPLVAAAFALQAPAAAGQDSTPFESANHGVRLKIPAGWTVDSTPQANLLLRINKGGAFPFPPAIIAQEMRLSEPATPGQLKEKLRTAYQSVLIEARILEEEPVKIAGQSGFSFTIQTRTPKGDPVMAVRTVIGDGPSRYVSVDADLPKAAYGRLRDEYDRLLGSLEFFPRRQPPGVAEEAAQWQELLPKLAGEPLPAAAKPGFKDEMVIEVKAPDGTMRQVGAYSFAVRPETQEATDGLSITISYKIDLGESGKQEVSTQGWLSRDFKRQRVLSEEARTGSDKRSTYFSADGSLENGQARATRRINGEKSVWSGPVDPATVLEDLVEGLQWRLATLGKRSVAVPVLSLYDPQPRPWRFEVSGEQSVQDGDRQIDVHVLGLQRHDGQRFFFWYDKQQRLVQRRATGGPIFRKVVVATPPPPK